VTFVKDGIDVDTVEDPLYWLNMTTKTYEPMGKAELDAICQGRARL
jgi:hypothetical protein